MKICITSMGDTLNSNVDPRFGRCKYFLIIDTDSMDVRSVTNDSMIASGGAGIQAAQIVVKTGVGAVITGNIGPNAFQTLNAAGIKVITGVNGVIKDVVDMFNKDELKKIETPTVGSHYGIGGTNRGFGSGGNL